MVILLTYPEALPDEADLLNEILGQHESLLVHLRKPEWGANQLRELLEVLDPTFRKRMVIHNHHQLAEEFGLKGIHLTEKDRAEGVWGENVVSTSFHDRKTAREEGVKFEYFFCSPVFPSISKPDYQSDENWTIISESAEFRSKAVALGGIEPKRIPELKDRGFEQFAVLGNVWQSNDPLAAIRTFVP